MASPPELTELRGKRIPAFPAQGRVERALDLIFPPVCVGCRKVGRWICSDCWPNVSWLDRTTCPGCGSVSLEKWCPRCRGNPSWLQGTDAVTTFEGAAREAVHALKFDGRHAIAGMMARLMAERVPAGVSVVVPVPLHPARKRERGYDQCVMLARRVARELGVRFEPGALRRVRRTRQQALLTDPEERLRNVLGAFEARIGVEAETIVLIDDVSTTGATLEAAAEPLVERDAGAVFGLVFASARTGPGGASHGRERRDPVQP